MFKFTFSPKRGRKIYVIHTVDQGKVVVTQTTDIDYALRFYFNERTSSPLDDFQIHFVFEPGAYTSLSLKAEVEKIIDLYFEEVLEKC